MKSSRLILSSIVAALLFVAPMVFAGDIYETQKFDSGEGNVNWSNGEVTATGFGVPPTSAVSAAQARAMAKRAAVVTARRNLLETVKGVKIVSETTVSNGMVENDTVKSFVEGFVKGSQVVKVQEYPDGSFEVTVGINMRGTFSDNVLGPTIYQGVPYVPKKVEPKEEAKPEVEQEASVVKTSDYTGIVFDASKLNPTQPCLSPKVLDMDGNEVYGSTVASREYVIKRGMAGYVDNVKEATNYELVKGNPYVVRGVQRKSSTTIIITNEDAEKIREINKNSNLLEQCKVVIVL